MKKKKSIGFRWIGNRTVIGIVCILAAIGICFGIAPTVQKLSAGKTTILRVSRTVPRGSCLTEADVETVEVGSYLSEKGIEKLRSSFAKSIFAQDWCNIYDSYTNARNTLRQESRERMREIIGGINAGTYENKTIENLLLQLARQLSTTTGKKQ